MKWLVAGPRGLTDWHFVWSQLNRIVELHGKPTAVVHGNAKGIDLCAGAWAKHNKILVITYAADWKTFGKGAGIIRNEFMLEHEKPEVVVAFQPKDSDTRGTQDTIKRTESRIAKGQNIALYVCRPTV